MQVYRLLSWGFLLSVFFLNGCITPDNAVIEGLGTPDATTCSTIPTVEDGALYDPRSAVELGVDGRTHPDLFYLAWAKLDDRSDLRFPEEGFDVEGEDDGLIVNGFEDKLLVTRKMADGTKRTWQLLPQLDNDCEDIDKIRIHSFDVAPNGRNLYLSMSRSSLDGTERDEHLAIYRFDIKRYQLEKISKDDATHFMQPTYVGNDPSSKHEILFITKSVGKDEIPNNYRKKVVLQDEYDRSPTTLIHTMDTTDGTTTRIGFNNSHQLEPFPITRVNGQRIVVFTQWEHMASVNRFALWKTQIDGSDTFTFFGQEASTDRSDQNLFQGREIKSGDYKGYVMMTQGNRADKPFAAEGDIIMTKREDFDLRSDKIYLQSVNKDPSDTHISRNAEHYNDNSFAYSYRETSNHTYNIYVKDFPSTLTESITGTSGEQITPSTNDYHFVQARSYYPPVAEQVSPSEGDISDNRISFTNNNLNNKSGFLVENITESDNGVQHQLDNTKPADLSMQFFIPSHHFSDSQAIGLEMSPEMSIPASGFIQPEADGSFGAILKNGLYIWKVNKKFSYNGENLWLPVRAERQEINFVPNRVNACNQCHQERDQANINKYEGITSTAATKMQGNLAGITDTTTYDASEEIPNFHKNIMPLFTKAAVNGGSSCATCHKSGTKLNLSNATGSNRINATFRTLVLGAHKLNDTTLIPYSYPTINPLGMDNDYHPAPFLWSLLLNDDLTTSEAGETQNSSRNLNRAGDYGAEYSLAVENSIKAINQQYDHSKHWSTEDMQAFITYSSTRMPVGLSDKIEFEKQGTGYTTSVAGQKAYQSMVRNCFSCHNSFAGSNGKGLEDADFGLPTEKRFSDPTDMRDPTLRFKIHNHIANKDDTKYSSLIWQSNLTTSIQQTLASALHRIDFDDPKQSELLTYSLGKDVAGKPLTLATHHVEHPQVFSSDADSDYLAIKNWVHNNAAANATTNQVPEITTPSNDNPITINIKEYDDPTDVPETIKWADSDIGSNGTEELSMVFLNQSNSSESLAVGGFSSDSLLTLDYLKFKEAKLRTYAILGDRGNQYFALTATDGKSVSEPSMLPVTVTSDYEVPAPSSELPSAYAFYTVKDSGSNEDAGQLRKLEHDSAAPDTPKDTLIGVLDGYNNDWSTVYRRSDRGWLYFVEQENHIIHVVDETNAKVLFHIQLDHFNNKEGSSHKQTNYLIWWRPYDGLDHSSDDSCVDGELQGLLESKLSTNTAKNGDFYIGLGCGELLDANGNVVAVNDEGDLPEMDTPPTYTLTPEYRTKLTDGGNTLSVYAWRKATFMSKWILNGVDSMNVLNLVTGKPKSLGDFDFPAKTENDIYYEAAMYLNVRAVVVAEDGAFYGFNKDSNDQPATVFNFDPLKDIQTAVETPAWVDEYFNNYINYGTPFLVIAPRSE